MNTWTKERPTQPGYYWLRYAALDGTIWTYPVKIVAGPGKSGLLVYEISQCSPSQIHHYDEFMEWMPLCEPT